MCLTPMLTAVLSLLVCVCTVHLGPSVSLCIQQQGMSIKYRVCVCVCVLKIDGMQQDECALTPADGVTGQGEGPW